MAENTERTWRNQVIYSIFVRNHTTEGTFEGVRRDLPRIRGLGVDVIWLLPIHPIGEKARKGVLGSPYAIRDYRAVNPEYGTLDDFRRMVDEAHRLGMRCVIDVVYNHTSPDSVLAAEHPEWFYHKEDGSFGNRVGDWSDIIDLDYTDRGLWAYQIETLKYWASMVDGFRCDVAPLVPLGFWREARAAVESVRPGCLWLAETVDPDFISALRAEGFGCLSDCQTYEAFDICYDYDIYPVFRDYLDGAVPLARYAEAVNRQEVTYPANYSKLRFLENHDQARAAFLVPDGPSLLNWTAFSFFQKGTGFIYAGQEAGCAHLPNLFYKDPVDWTGPDRSEQFRRLCALKKHPLMADSAYTVQALPGDVLYAVHRKGGRRLAGVFSVRGGKALVRVDVPDGWYENLFDGGRVEVKDARVSCRGVPVIIETAQ
ncbi:MAG: alpha-amylase [Oscillospiraceae bacterium]|jgi:glycosidase|nr:alpha-amylase [Oscillospiraceae bacterium]MCI9288766.1 alpha-amylase [Oscillospiraceae bacterium]MCI9550047.1 alpha-amylase [Oscillospiraceae bacterium]